MPASRSDDDLGAFGVAWWFIRGRTGRRGLTITPSTRPTMPRSQWRPLAALCFAVGAIVGGFIGGDGGRAVLLAVVGGLIGLVVGMYVIETIWERRRARRLGGAPGSPQEKC